MSVGYISFELITLDFDLGTFASVTGTPGTLEALDTVCIPYAYGCDVPSIGPPTGVFVLPFGGVSASEGVPSANCSTDNRQLYLNVFQNCSEFCGGNLRRDRTTTFRLVCRTQDVKLYLDAYQKYRHGCKEVSREGPNMISNDIPSVDCKSQKFKSTDAVDVFQAYSALCLRGIGGRRSVNVRRTTTTTVSSCNFIHDNGLCNTGPSTSHGGRNARGNPDVSLTTGGATCSRGIGGRRSNFIHDNDVRNIGPSTSRAGRNARGNPDVSLTTGEATCSRGIGGRRSNFIHDNDVRNTGPSTSRASRNARGNPDVSLNVRNTLSGGRNTRANPEVGLTTTQATYSSGVTRRHSVRRRPSTRGPTVGSSSASGAGTSYTYTDFRDSDQSCRHCGDSFWIHNSDLDPQMVEGLIHFLDSYNELVQLFKTTRDKCRELDIPEFKIRFYNDQGARGYVFTTSNTLGAMVFKSGITSNTVFDVIIQHKDGPPQRVNKFHPSYMSLQFPLLFIYGQSGYHTDLKLRSADGRGRARRITMLAYYRYQLHFCLQQYGLLFRDGRLFQQYVVDALAICRRLGNPQFFITFTCNVNWPEIKRFMAQYPELTDSDRTDVMCWIFEQKIQSFVTFLKDERIFGNVIGVLTVEFQKRGLPHCHTLLWVDSESTIKIDEDVD
ncbi:DNA helicase [Tanacetum coccineum]